MDIYKLDAMFHSFEPLSFNQPERVQQSIFFLKTEGFRVAIILQWDAHRNLGTIVCRTLVFVQEFKLSGQIVRYLPNCSRIVQNVNSSAVHCTVQLCIAQDATAPTPKHQRFGFNLILLQTTIRNTRFGFNQVHLQTTVLGTGSGLQGSGGP